jgi:hypothetical protein
MFILLHDTCRDRAEAGGADPEQWDAADQYHARPTGTCLAC